MSHPELLTCRQYTAGLCTSCTQIQVPYSAQLASKQQRTSELLKPFLHPQVLVDSSGANQCATGDSLYAGWLEPVASAISGFRNKAKFVVSGSRGKLVLGIVGEQGAVDLTMCPIQDTRVNAAAVQVRDWLNTLPLAGYDLAARRGDLKFVHISVARTGALLVRFVVRTMAAASVIAEQANKLRTQLPQIALCSVNLLPEHKAVLEGEEEFVLWGAALPMPLKDVQLQLLPRSFFQTNTDMAIALYQQARTWAEQIKPASVLDLYCGVGGFALHLAESKSADSASERGKQETAECASFATRRVVGVELSEYAVRAAKKSAREQQLAATFIAADATEYALGLVAEQLPELLVVNPPRRGIGNTLCEWISSSAIEYVIYSSCNPQSLAADLARVPNYRIISARLFDMFAHTSHLEVAVLLQRL